MSRLIAHSQNRNLLVNKNKATLINESGLYSLILSSKLPKAKQFKRWVTSEVLPSIRKTGKYSLDIKDKRVVLKDLVKLVGLLRDMMIKQRYRDGAVVVKQACSLFDIELPDFYDGYNDDCSMVCTITEFIRYFSDDKNKNEFIEYCNKIIKELDS